MSRFRAFPYRGSLLRSQTGAVQEVSQPLQPVHTAGTIVIPGNSPDHCFSQEMSQNKVQLLVQN